MVFDLPITKFESKVFKFERLYPLSLVEVSKSPKILGPKVFLDQNKILGTQKILGPKQNFGNTKNFETKTIVCL